MVPTLSVTCTVVPPIEVGSGREDDERVVVAILAPKAEAIDSLANCAVAKLAAEALTVAPA